MERGIVAQKQFKPGGVVGWAMSVWRARAVAGEVQRKQRGLQVRETLSLGGRRQIALVTCGEREFLVGLCADTVDAIVAIDEPRNAHIPARAHWEGGF